ncbi:hypothetical protein NW807_00850 [Synechococcus sp. R70.1]|uniref:hypothetical protein n=1 Tax=Synechococcus sp. R70.1 TaxID=2964531 RepID=UPI0039C439D9
MPDPSGSCRSPNLGYAQLTTYALPPSVRDPTLLRRQMPYLRAAGALGRGIPDK